MAGREGMVEGCAGGGLTRRGGGVDVERRHPPSQWGLGRDQPAARTVCRCFVTGAWEMAGDGHPSFHCTLTLCERPCMNDTNMTACDGPLRECTDQGAERAAPRGDRFGSNVRPSRMLYSTQARMYVCARARRRAMRAVTEERACCGGASRAGVASRVGASRWRAWTGRGREASGLFPPSINAIG